MFANQIFKLNKMNSVSRQQINYWKNRIFTENICFTTRTTRNLSSTIQQQEQRKSSNDNGELIYYGPLKSKMKAVKIFSLTTSVGGLAAQPILLEQGSKLGGTGLAILICSFAGFFTFVTPFLLHFITKKYVTEIYYHSKNDEYVATTVSLFLRKIETKFKANDVSVPEVPGMFTSIIIRKTPLFIDPSQFYEPEHYVKIMGFDKPIDFKIEPDSGNTKHEK